MTVSGISLIQGVRDRHIPSYPSEGQVRGAIFYPLLGLASSIVVLWFAPRLSGWVKGSVLCIALLAVFPLVFAWGGGM